MTIAAVFLCGPGQPGKQGIVSCDFQDCRAMFLYTSSDTVRENVRAGWRRDLDAPTKHWCPRHSGAGRTVQPG